MKRMFFIIIALLFLIPLTTAVNIDMKTNFSQGETFIAKISGDFYYSISKENIIFDEGHVRTSIIPFVTKINNDFYIYAQLLGKAPGNYSIILHNIIYFQGNRIIEGDISKNFTINNNTADFSVNPGFIITDKDFFIELNNLQDNEITINSKILNKSTNSSNKSFFDSLFGSTENNTLINLNPGETKKVNFNITGLEKFNIIELSTKNLKYEVPIYILSKKEKEYKENFRFEPAEINFSIPVNSRISKTIYIYNTGKEGIKNVSLNISDSLIPYANFSNEKINEINGNSSRKFNISFYSDTKRKVKGQITATSNTSTIYLPVFLNFLNNSITVINENGSITVINENGSITVINENGSIPATNKEIKEEPSSGNCSDLNGKICGSEYKCGGKIKYATDGVCCIGTCVKIEKSSVGKTIGWTLIFVIVIFLVWFYFKKYKGIKSVSNLMKILQRKGRR